MLSKICPRLSFSLRHEFVNYLVFAGMPRPKKKVALHSLRSYAENDLVLFKWDKHWWPGIVVRKLFRKRLDVGFINEREYGLVFRLLLPLPH